LTQGLANFNLVNLLLTLVKAFLVTWINLTAWSLSFLFLAVTAVAANLTKAALVFFKAALLAMIAFATDF
jgi:cell division protein FtsB